MHVGVIGSGSIGPDLAYGFLTAVAKGGGSVVLQDIDAAALGKGRARIQGYVVKAVARGKLGVKEGDGLLDNLITTTDVADLARCSYVLEAASENLRVKKQVLARLEEIVDRDCLIGFATSGIPRAQIAAEAKHPERCFVNHPFFPAWRALPIEVVLSGDEALGERMLNTLKQLGKVPIVTTDVACFAADDIFVNYCAEAARIVAEGLAAPSQVDKVVDEAVGGGGPFRVMDLTRGNLLNVHCLEMMRDAPTGSAWFQPPPIFTQRGNDAWHPGGRRTVEPCAPQVEAEIRDRILAVLLGRTAWVADQGICDPSDLNWLTRMALGFRDGLLDVIATLGADHVHDICTRYAARFAGFDVPASIAAKRPHTFFRHLVVTADNGIATVAVRRPEVRNALSTSTLAEIGACLRGLDADAAVRGIVLTSFDGALAGADIGELAALPDPAACQRYCDPGHAILNGIGQLSKPVVAALDGPVLGGGCELAMACHARVVGRRLVLGQPEVNLGLIPGYGGTQRLPRLIGVERALQLLRTGSPIGAAEACAWGWARGAPAKDVRAEATHLLQRHLAGEVTLRTVDPAPIAVPTQLAKVELGHRSLAIDEILVDVVRRGLSLPLAEGLVVETQGFGRCRATTDMDIGVKNFLQNGARVPAAFLHE
jgi:enoyl-CoA hydratase/3-hydroxyacyl-CoA dehydrogenase